MLKLPRKTRTTHPPSPLQPYVDSGAGPGWMLAAHVVEKLPKTLIAAGTLVAALLGGPAAVNKGIEWATSTMTTSSTPTSTTSSSAMTTTDLARSSTAIAASTR